MATLPQIKVHLRSIPGRRGYRAVPATSRPFANLMRAIGHVSDHPPQP
jgi:hypothetical protein